MATPITSTSTTQLKRFEPATKPESKSGVVIAANLFSARIADKSPLSSSEFKVTNALIEQIASNYDAVKIIDEIADQYNPDNYEAFRDYVKTQYLRQEDIDQVVRELDARISEEDTNDSSDLTNMIYTLAGPTSVEPSYVSTSVTSPTAGSSKSSYYQLAKISFMAVILEISLMQSKLNLESAAALAELNNAHQEIIKYMNVLQSFTISLNQTFKELLHVINVKEKEKNVNKPPTPSFDLSKPMDYKTVAELFDVTNTKVKTESKGNPDLDYHDYYWNPNIQTGYDYYVFKDVFYVTIATNGKNKSIYSFALSIKNEQIPKEFKSYFKSINGSYTEVNQEMLNNLMKDLTLQLALIMPGYNDSYFLDNWGSQILNSDGCQQLTGTVTSMIDQASKIITSTNEKVGLLQDKRNQALDLLASFITTINQLINS